MNKKIIVFDTETKLLPGKDCGWDEKDKMGISVAVAYDYSTNDTSVFLGDNLDKLVEMLNGADLIAHFNGQDFDQPLVRGEAKALGLTASLKDNKDLKVYDMLVESRRGAKVSKFDKGFKLDQHLEAIWGQTQLKTGDGAMAPELYKSGKIGELISYCIADVRRERLLFEYIWYTGQLKSAGHPEPYKVLAPQEVLGVPLDTRLPYTLFPTTDRGLRTVLDKFKEHVA